jgi:outer membrane protein insertion porin family
MSFCYIINRFFLGWLLVATVLISCNVTKHLDTDKGERLLTKNTLEIKSATHIPLSQKRSIRYETENLFKQKPNRSFLKLHLRLAAYYKYKDRSKRFANFVNKKIAEPPSIIKEDLCQLSAIYFQNFMRKRGYFDATCTYELKMKGTDKVEAIYLLDLGQLYTISSIELISKDSNILSILQKNNAESNIKVGAPLDGRLFDAEKTRITKLLRNEGYAQFIPNYIEFTGDSTTAKVSVGLEVLPFNNEKNDHPVFKIGNVSVFSSLVPDVNTIRNDTLLNNIKYYSNEPKFMLKPKHLDRVIKTRPGELFRQKNFEQSYKNMSNLGAFRFVSIRPTPDSLRKDTMNVDIYFAPAKRSSIGANADFRYISSPGLIGVTSSVFHKHRNLFRGAELLQTNLTGNIEFNTDVKKQQAIFLWEAKLQNDLLIPRFLDYVYVWKALNKLHFGKKKIVSDHLYQLMQESAKAHIGLNTNFVSQNNFFTSGQIDASFGYNLNPGGQKTYSFTHLGLDWLQYLTFFEQFDNLKLRSPLFAKRTSNQLFTGFLLRSFSYKYFSKTNLAGEKYVFRFNSEVSGLEVDLLNRAFRPKETWRLNENLDFAKYFRFEVGGSYSRSFTNHILIGGMINTGIIVPFGRTQKTNPFVKQFSIGGPSSIRAWPLRQLGPGTYYNADINKITPYFQASDIKIEFNSEIRFPLFWYFKGAVFLDGGNIWALRVEQERPGAKWYRNSYKDIALGTGFGLRFDFGYSVIRFDLGMKLRTPYKIQDSGSNWVNLDLTQYQFFKNTCTMNIAVGYPF